MFNLVFFQFFFLQVCFYSLLRHETDSDHSWFFRYPIIGKTRGQRVSSKDTWPWKLLAFNFSHCYRSSRQRLLRPLLKTLRSKLQRGSCKSDPRIRVLIQIEEVVGLDYSHNKIFERSFFELAINCASVICCRYSLKQKLVWVLWV